MKFRYPLIALSVSVAMMTGCKVPSFMPSLGTVSQAEADTTTSRQLSMARLNERHGQRDLAVKIYESILEDEPTNSEAMHRLGVVAAENEQYEIAVQHFQQALQLDASNPELLSDMGYVHFLMDDLASAESYLEAALQADPRHESAHNNLGLVKGQQGRWNESLVHFRQAVEDGEAYANLAYIQTQVGEIELAEANFLRALDHDSELQPAAEGLVQLTEQKAMFERQMLARAQQAAPAPELDAVVNSPQRLAASRYTQPRRSNTPITRVETSVGNYPATNASPVRVVSATGSDQSSPVVNATYQDPATQPTPATPSRSQAESAAPSPTPAAQQAVPVSSTQPVISEPELSQTPDSGATATAIETTPTTYPVTAYGSASPTVTSNQTAPRRPDAIDSIGQHDYYQGGPAVALPQPIHQATPAIEVDQPKPQFLTNADDGDATVASSPVPTSLVPTSPGVPATEDSAAPATTVELPPSVTPTNRQPAEPANPEAGEETGTSHSFSG